MGPFTHDSIRLSPETKNNLKKNRKIFNLINRLLKKFEESIMIARGICYYGLGKLMILEGTLNEFGYGQALLFYQEDIKRLNSENKVNFIFEQDGAKSHTSKANLNLLNNLFSEGNWLQNPPNSPDLAYPIEDIWAIIKPRIKRREPKSLDELKKFTIEEWYLIPKTII